MEDTNLFMMLWSNLFARGLMLGLVICFYFWFQAKLKIRELNSSLRKLREHLHTKLEIDSQENERRKSELETLRQERDNLRNKVQVLNQKPGRVELRQYQVYQKAIDIMFEKAPGFAPAWQITLKEAEEEMQKSERGIIPFFKRIKQSTMSSGDSSGSGNNQSEKKILELHGPSTN